MQNELVLGKWEILDRTGKNGQKRNTANEKPATIDDAIGTTLREIAKVFEGAKKVDVKLSN